MTKDVHKVPMRMSRLCNIFSKINTKLKGTFAKKLLKTTKRSDFDTVDC